MWAMLSLARLLHLLRQALPGAGSRDLLHRVREAEVIAPLLPDRVTAIVPALPVSGSIDPALPLREAIVQAIIPGP